MLRRHSVHPAQHTSFMKDTHHLPDFDRCIHLPSLLLIRDPLTFLPHLLRSEDHRMSLLSIPSRSSRFLTVIHQTSTLSLMNDETNVTIIDPQTKSARSHQDLHRSLLPLSIDRHSHFL